MKFNIIKGYMNSENILFWITIAGIAGTGLHLLIRCFYKMKCSQCNICYGLINVQRDVAQEEITRQYDLEHNVKRSRHYRIY
jgi:hypothetical protein